MALWLKQPQTLTRQYNGRFFRRAVASLRETAWSNVVGKKLWWSWQGKRWRPDIMQSAKRHRSYKSAFLSDRSRTLGWGCKAACCAGASLTSICTWGSTRVPLCKLFPDLAWHEWNLTLLCPIYHAENLKKSLYVADSKLLGCFLVEGQHFKL